MMAFEDSVSYKGQNKVDTLTSTIRLEEGKGRLVVTRNSLKNLILGVLPDGSIGFIIVKDGIDAENVFS